VLASNAVPRVASAAALLALVFAASGSAHVTAGPGSGAFIGGNGDILFMSIRVRNGPEQPYLMRPDGTRVRRLTRDRSCYGGPAWSPDGRWLAFARYLGKPGIWTMNVNGSGLRPLTRGELDTAPTWSPDGSTIAFARETGSGAAIWLVDVNGSNQRQLTTPRGAGDFQPDWSLDGDWIAFSRATGPGGRHDICAVRPDGTGLRQLTSHARGNYSPAWSPDGKRIVFMSGRAHPGLMDIYVMNADGKRETRLTKGTIDNNSPDWRARP
jgi:TolB protein